MLQIKVEFKNIRTNLTWYLGKTVQQNTQNKYSLHMAARRRVLLTIYLSELFVWAKHTIHLSKTHYPRNRRPGQ